MRLLNALIICALAAACIIMCTEAKSSGVLSYCDLTPITDHNGLTWLNGCIGRHLGFRTCNDNNIMGWANEPLPNGDYTLRSGDLNGRDASKDPTSYVPGSFLNELHLRTYNISARIVGALLYATNGTDPVSQKETQVGTWTVLPAQGGTGFQVSASCGYTAVTHSGADIKPLHSRLFFSAPAGTGAVRFRLLLKIGGQGTGFFAYPTTELRLTQGPAPVVPQRNTPAVYGQRMVNGSMQSVVITPAVIVPLQPLSSASDDGTKVNVLGAPGQACADACFEQVPAYGVCHAQAITAINSEAAFLSAAAGLIDCDLPTLGMCPYAGAPRTLTTPLSKQCRYRSMDIASTCAPWAVAAINAAANGRTQAATVAALFGLGTSTTANRANATYVPDVCYSAPWPNAQNLCVCTNNPKYHTKNMFSQALLDALKTPHGVDGRRSVVSAEQQEDDADSSAAPSRATGALSGAGLLLALVSSMFTLGVPRLSSGGRTSQMSFLVLLCALCMVSISLSSAPVQAHNFMKSLHRAQEAAVSGPCQARIGNSPHVQVAPNQAFEMEWANGHADCCGNFYYVTLPASAYNELLAENITDIIKYYLDNAPASSYRSAGSDAAMWERHHLRRSDERNPSYYWKEPNGMPSTDPTFIVQDPVYGAKKHPSNTRPQDLTNGVTLVQTRFTDAWKPADRRVVYTNSMYPWIEAIDEFPNPYNVKPQPGDDQFPDYYSQMSDIARFNFPARHGPGDYILWYFWSGYRDCVDVNVPAGVTHVENRYGNPATEVQTAVKIDHCQLRYVQQANTPMRLIDRTTRNVSQCLADCIAAGPQGCTYVQAVRRTNPAQTAQYKVLPNIPWVPYIWNATRWAIQPQAVDWPCSGISPQDMANRGCKRTDTATCKAEGMDCYVLFNALDNTDPARFPDPQDEDYYCYGTIPYRDEGAQVYEDYVVSTDPTDPVYYSTCWVMTSVNGFIGIPPMNATVPVWTADSACIECSFYEQALANRMDQVSFWDEGVVFATGAGGSGSTSAGSSGVCTDCSLYASQARTVRAGLAELSVGADMYWSGLYGAQEKQQFVNAGGNPNALPSTSSDDNGGLTPVGPSDQPTSGGNGDANSSSKTQLLGMKLLYGILVLAGAGIGALLLVVALVCAVRRRAQRKSQQTLNRMGGDRGISTQMSPNPVHAAPFQRL